MIYLILLIPAVISVPIFDLVDPETGEEREMTPEEQTELDDYLARLENYNAFASVLNQWPLNGVYEEVINCNKAPTWEKEGERFNLFILRTMRVNSFNIIAFVNQQRVNMMQADLDFEIVIDNEHRGWLADNNYTPVKGEV